MPSKESRALRVCLTGGGTAGHVTPHFALLPGLRRRGWQAFYVGSAGLEKGLVEAQGIEFIAVATGKLRRYLSVKNLIDVFKVGFGCVQAFWVLARKRPDVVFSKGGFVAVPVAWAAWALRVPVVSHESDLTPGLATKLIAPVAQQILYTFPETAKYLKGRAEQVGTPVRPELLAGDRKKGLAACGFPDDGTPTILVMGGSQGAQRLNDALREALPWLLERARVVHLTGAGKGFAGFSHPRYKAFEFVRDGMGDLLAAADRVVSRAGANSLFELLAMTKPMLLIPLEVGSRGDQVVNAASFERRGLALVLREAGMTPASFKDALTELENQAATLRKTQAEFNATAGSEPAEKILAALGRAAGQSDL